MTIDDLKQYLARKNELRNLITSTSERVARMKSAEQFPSMKISDGSQHVASASDLTAQAIESRLEYVYSNECEIANLTAQVRAVEIVVNSISDSQQRQILRYRYMDAEFCQNPRWNEIARKMYGTDQERFLQLCFRVHRVALESFERIGANDS